MKKLRETMAIAMAEAREAAMADPQLEYQILARAKAKEQAAVADAPSPYAKIRAAQARQESEGLRRIHEKQFRKAAPWSDEMRGGDELFYGSK